MKSSKNVWLVSTFNKERQHFVWEKWAFILASGVASPTISAASKVGEVELDLIPSLIESHWHRADERLHARRGLTVGRAEPAPHVLVIQHLK